MGPAQLPGGWRSRSEPDGTLLLTHRTPGCLTLFLLVFTGIWNTVTGTFVALGLGFMSGVSYSGPELGSLGFWAFLTPFILIGLGTFAGFLACLFGHNEWRVGHNFLEAGYRFLGFRRPRTYEDARLDVQETVTPHGKTACLYATTETGRHVLARDAAARPGGEAVLLGQFLAEQTGWKLKLPPEPSSAEPTVGGDTSDALPAWLARGRGSDAEDSTRSERSSASREWTVGRLRVTRDPGMLTIIDTTPMYFFLAQAAFRALGVGILIWVITSQVSFFLQFLPTSLGGTSRQSPDEAFDFMFVIVPLVIGCMVLLGIVQSVFGILRALAAVIRGSNHVVLDSAMDQLTIRGVPVCSLQDITGVRLKRRSAGESSAAYQVLAEIRGRRRVDLSGSQTDASGTEALALAVAEMTSQPLLRS